MASPAARFRKQVPTDVWAVRERLALACSVLRSGDQNWVSVSRAIRSFSEPNRPSDWFSQKNCALQYSELLEKVEAPKRKRADRGESDTAGDLIVRKLSNERTDELKKHIQERQLKYKKLKREIEAIRAGQFDDKLPQIWQEMQQHKKAVQEAAAAAKQKAAEESAARAAAAAARVPGKPLTLQTKLKRPQPGLKLKTPGETEEVVGTQDTVPETENIKVEERATTTTSSQNLTPPNQLEVKPKPTPPSSPLLSSLLQNKHELQQKALSAQQPTATQQKRQVVGQPAPSTSREVNQGTMSQVAAPVGVPPVKTEITLPVPTIEIKEEPAEPVVPPEKPAKKDIPELKKLPTPVSAVVTPAAPVRSIVAPAALSTTTVSPLPTTSPATVPSAVVKTEVSSSVSVAEAQEEIPVFKTTTSEPPSTPTAPTTPTRDVSKAQVVFLKEQSSSNDGSTDAVKVLAQLAPEEDPASPASSIVSNETDSGSAKGLRTYARKNQRRGRGSRRISQRLTRGRIQEDEKAPSTGKPSEAESSDDEANQAESDDGTITMTPKMSLSMSESIPNSPASLSQCDTEDERGYKLWKKSIMLVWRAAANHKYANVFLHPVTNEIAPGYTSVVIRPMDLSAIKKNIESGANRTTAEFQRDMMLMFTNAIMYNNSDHDVYNMAVEMYNDVMIHIEQYVNTQMMVQSEGTKILRQSRRSEASMSDKEDDPKKRKPSTEMDYSHGGKSKKRK